MSRIIECHVNDEYILGSGVAIGAVGSHASILLRIKFNDNWDGLNIHATWTDALGTDGEDYNQLLLPSHEVEERTYEIGVPAFATRHSGTVRLSFSGFVIGEDGEEISQVLNTASGLFKVLDSNAVRLDDEKIDATSEEQVQTELVAFGKRMTALEGEMDEWDTALDKAENGYTDDDGIYVPGRVQNEDKRVDAEAKRDEAEKLRAAAEADRVQAEKERQETFEANETERVIFEQERRNFENQRIENEEGRINAETYREERFAQMETIVGDLDKGLDAILTTQELIIGGGDS